MCVCLSCVRERGRRLAEILLHQAEAVSRITVGVEKRQLISVFKMGYSRASRPFRFSQEMISFDLLILPFSHDDGHVCVCVCVMYGVFKPRKREHTIVQLGQFW